MHSPFNAALKPLALACALTLTQCAPPGQELFGGQVQHEPVYTPPPAPPKKAAPKIKPFLSIPFGTPYEEYRPVVARGAHLALEGKPNVLFEIKALIPANASQEMKNGEIKAAESYLLPTVAQIIQRAGARPIQTDISLEESFVVDTPIIVVNLK